MAAGYTRHYEHSDTSVARLLYREVEIRRGSTEEHERYYRQTPKFRLENKGMKIYWNDFSSPGQDSLLVISQISSCNFNFS
jgi:hypothetical protein